MTFEQQWANASADENPPSNMDPPGEGAFQVALTAAKALVSKKGNEVVILELRAVGPPSDGYEWTHFLRFEPQGVANIAKRTCHLIGVAVDAVESLDDLNEALQEHVGNYYDIEVKRNGDYLNVYFDGPSQSLPPTPPTQFVTDGPRQTAAKVVAGIDDDIPF